MAKKQRAETATPAALTVDEVRQAAIECLGKAFNGGSVRPEVIQAAVSIVHLTMPGPGGGVGDTIDRLAREETPAR